MKMKNASQRKVKKPPDKPTGKVKPVIQDVHESVEEEVLPEEAITNVSKLIKTMNDFKDVETQYLRATVSLFMEKLVGYNQQYVDILQSTYKDSDELSEKVTVIKSINDTRVALINRVKNMIKGSRMLEEAWNDIINKMDKLLQIAKDYVVTIEKNIPKITGIGKVKDVKEKLLEIHEREMEVTIQERNVIIKEREVIIHQLAEVYKENTVICTTDFEYEELDWEKTFDCTNWSEESCEATAVIHNVNLQEADIFDLQTMNVLMTDPSKSKELDEESNPGESMKVNIYGNKIEHYSNKEVYTRIKEQREQQFRIHRKAIKFKIDSWKQLKHYLKSLMIAFMMITLISPDLRPP